MASIAGPIVGSAIASAVPWLLDKFAGGKPAQQQGFIQNLDPRSQQLFSQFQNKVGSYDLAANPLYQQAQGALSSSPFGQSFDPSQANQAFQQGVADPTTKYYQEQIEPNLRQGFYSPSSGAVYGSALNRALTQAASDLGTGLGSLRSNYLQQQQQQHAKGQLDWVARALGLAQAPINQESDLMSRLFGIQNVNPIVQEAQSGFGGNFKQMLGILGPIISQLMQQRGSGGFNQQYGSNPNEGFQNSPDLAMENKYQQF